MHQLLYYIIIIPLSLLPHFVLYKISDLLCVVMKDILKYRKDIILGNIKRSFPEKTVNQQLEIYANFYRHFCDLLIENLKGFTITKTQIKSRLKMSNPELVNDYFEKGKSIILIGGHYNNWEITAQGCPIYLKHELYAIYKPLKNDFYNNKMRSTREKFGLYLTPMKLTKKYFELETNNPKAIIFGSDQSPSNVKNAYWTTFLNQDTGFLFGAEKYAKDYNYPVIYVHIEKVKRGFYRVNFELICESPRSLKHGEIMELFSEKLEKNIVDIPHNWLWSHHRWKKSKPL
ncbi:MAG: lysophospholipid acyltransferase family protein [Bacteroidota bacterium]|nr:lysophospholipid acyltransferase family protein [Bacteroidota bacterium]